MGQYSKGTNVQPKENHNVHAQISNASELKFERSWDR